MQATTSRTSRRSRTRLVIATAALAALVTVSGCTGEPTMTAAPSPAVGGSDEASGPMALTREQVDAALPKIPGIVEAAMEASGVPGVSVAIVHEDQAVFAEGFGVRELGTDQVVDADTVFSLASLSKPVSSSVVASAVGDGVIAWDDPIVEHNPDLQLADPWVTEHVTFEDLYAHRSGLPGGAGDALENMGYDRDEVIRRLRFIEPGEFGDFRNSYAYTNFGMTIAGDAAAKADGTTFAEMAEARVFGPAGMDSTTASRDVLAGRENRALFHARVGDEWVPDFANEGRVEAGVPAPTTWPDAQAPAGGVSSTANDMARWMRLSLGEGTLDGTEIIDAAALGTTHVPQIRNQPPTAPVSDPASFYGLGWGVTVDRFNSVHWQHSGAFTLGAATTVALMPNQQLGVIVLTNGSPIGLPEAIVDEILDTLFFGEPTQDWVSFWAERFSQLFAPDPTLETPPADPAPEQPAEAYTGTYANDFYGAFEVAERDGNLVVIEGPARNTFTLEHWDANTFVYNSDPELAGLKTRATFVVGPDGRATTLTIDDLDSYGTGTLTRV